MAKLKYLLQTSRACSQVMCMLPESSCMLNVQLAFEELTLSEGHSCSVACSPKTPLRKPEGCSVVQAASLGGQLAVHCRREADLGLVTPQELLQSAQRQRCYLGYIPQPPQVTSHTPYMAFGLRSDSSPMLRL